MLLWNKNELFHWHPADSVSLYLNINDGLFPLRRVLRLNLMHTHKNTHILHIAPTLPSMLSLLPAVTFQFHFLFLSQSVFSSFCHPICLLVSQNFLHLSPHASLSVSSLFSHSSVYITLSKSPPLSVLLCLPHRMSLSLLFLFFVN